VTNRIPSQVYDIVLCHAEPSDMRYSSTTTPPSIGQRTYQRHPANRTRYCQDKNAHSSSQTTPSRTGIDSTKTQCHYSFRIRLLQPESSKYRTRYSHTQTWATMQVPILKPSCLTREREKFYYLAPTSRTGQIFLIPASHLPHVLKCPNQLSDTLVRGTTTIKTMPRSIFSSTLVRPSIFRDMRQICWRIIRPRVFATRIYHQWTPRTHCRKRHWRASMARCR